jgi:aminopeptidase-like protein
LEKLVPISDLLRTTSFPELGQSMTDFMADLFPICRSITGAGLRETLSRIGDIIPLQLTEVPSGTEAFDWTVPREWNISDAWVADARGERVIDFRCSNLHVVNYSVPVKQTLPLDELRPHLHSLPEHPTWIPYRTSYYAEDWGFCLSDEALRQLPPGQYEAVIDATLQDGSLSYGECVLPGSSSDEILISSHACHPSLANDNLSGVAVATFLARQLTGVDHRFTYRFLFAPGTIGAITWLARNEGRLPKVRGGLVLACVGDAGSLIYKRSRRGDAYIDVAAEHVLRGRPHAGGLVDFSPYGNDERQYCSPGFDLPVGAITRSGHDRSERHHTSADDLASISADALADTLAACLSILRVLDDNALIVSLNPKGEPQLGRRGLYRSFGGRADQATLESALLWVMSCADGAHSLLDVAERAALPFAAVFDAAVALEEAKLLRREPLERDKRIGAIP